MSGRHVSAELTVRMTTLPRLPRRFLLIREVDDSGVSGVGVVAEGVEFSDGRVALRWVSAEQTRSTAVWDEIRAVQAVHGHGGHTRVEWVD